MLFLGEGWIHKMQIVEHFREFVWLPPPPSTSTRLRNGNRLDKKLEKHRKSFNLMGNVFIWKQLQSPPRRRIIKAGSLKHNLKGKDIMETKMRMCVLVRLRVQAAWHLTMNRSPMSRLSLLLRMLNANHGGDKKWQVHQKGDTNSNICSSRGRQGGLYVAGCDWRRRCNKTWRRDPLLRDTCTRRSGYNSGITRSNIVGC